MGLFGFGKKESVVDLAERFRQQKEDEREAEAEGNGSEDNPNEFSDTDTTEERKKKLAKRIISILDRLDDLSTKLYHLQQRVELLERKINVGQP